MFLCFLYFDSSNHLQLADPRFPRGGGRQPYGRGFAKFSQKLHDIERILENEGLCTSKFYYLDLPRTCMNSLSHPNLVYFQHYRSGTVNSNTINSKFHLIRSNCEIFFYNFPNIPCLKYTVNSNFHLIRSKTLPTNDFELTVPDLHSQNHRPHGSRPFHWFAWYNS